MKEKSSRQLFGAVAQLQAELYLFKVEKLDVCIRPLFAKYVRRYLSYLYIMLRNSCSSNFAFYEGLMLNQQLNILLLSMQYKILIVYRVP